MNSMYPILLALVLMAFMPACSGKTLPYLTTEATSPPDYSPYTALLKQYVAKNGDVNYARLVEKRAALDKICENFSQHPPSSQWSREEQLAYWINAYNLFTLKLIVDHYPVESITKIKKIHIPLISTIWGKQFFKIGNKRMSLGQIEHKILRKHFDEPRIHFAINCASFSCPKLRDEAFTANAIESQLQEQSIDFVNNPLKNTISESAVEVSRIFLWFKGDFTGEGDLIAYLNQFSEITITANAAVSYANYDWSLNEQKPGN